MAHTGATCNRITLTPNVMETISYSASTFSRHMYLSANIDIVNYGGGDIYVNWKGAASIGGEDSLLLKEGVGYEIREGTYLDNFSLNIISDSAAVVQVVKSR